MTAGGGLVPVFSTIQAVAAASHGSTPYEPDKLPTTVAC